MSINSIKAAALTVVTADAAFKHNFTACLEKDINSEKSISGHALIELFFSCSQLSNVKDVLFLVFETR